MYILYIHIICVTESFCYTAEMNRTWEINCISIKTTSHKKKIMADYPMYC